MNVAIIGRSEIMFETAELFAKTRHSIPLIITSREAPEYTKTSDNFQVLARNLDATFIHTARIGSADVVEKIRNLGSIDIALSVNYSGLIPQNVIDLFSIGVLNAHGGDLPRYRGNACQAWALINGEDKIGLCIHKMIGGELDNGDIIQREYIQTNINTKIGEVWQWMYDRIPHMFLSAVESLSDDFLYVLEQQSKDPKDALRCYPRRPEDGRIDWSKPAEQVLRLINASGPPYAGAYAQFEGEKLVILDAELVSDDENFCAVPGQVTKIERETNTVVVAAGQSKISIKEVCYEGQVLSPTQFIKSIRSRIDNG